MIRKNRITPLYKSVWLEGFSGMFSFMITVAAISCANPT